MHKVLYIGNNPEPIKAFDALPDKFQISQVPNGLKALSYLKNHESPDAIICEARLQGMNGIDVGKMIRGVTENSKTPFILFIFEKDETILKSAFKVRKIIDDVYQFPFTLTKLNTRIDFLKKYYEEIDDIKPASAFKEYKIPFMKRTFDILVSSFALLLLSPLLIITALAIRLESKGKVIYKSKRVGTGYKIFGFFKFRSMYLDADSRLKELKHLNQYNNKEEDNDSSFNTDCPKCAKLPNDDFCSPVLYIEGMKICEHWYIEQKKKQESATFIKIKNDPRVTKVGNFIRNTSIDELPQLFNVLKGDMSIVGNRPLPLYEAEQLTSDDWSARFMGPAGITGLWQVELRGKKGIMSEEERKSLDNKYAETYSFWGDIRLIFRTIPALLQKENV